MKWVLRICMLVLLLSIPIPPITSQTTVTQSTKLPPIRFWRADISDLDIIEISVFPMVSLSSNAELLNLGKAWITWKINVSNQYLAAFAIYNHGKLENYTVLPNLFTDITFFGSQEILLAYGSTSVNAQFYFYNSTGNMYSIGVGQPSTDHKIYVSQTEFFLYSKTEETNQAHYFIPSGFSFRPYTTNEVVLDTGLGMAIINNGQENVLYTSDTNYTLPDFLSSNIKVGHNLLFPSVFDLDNDVLWKYDGETIPLPKNSEQVYFYGMQSSIVRTANMSFYEYRMDQWIKLGQFDYDVMGFSIIDINLYIGTVLDAGISLVAAGEDEDGDGIPTTMEDYYGSYPTKTDSDDDTIPDGWEIAYGTNPRKLDSQDDPDNDGLSNQGEYIANTDPNNPDSDYGGALDGWEIKYGLNATDAFDDDQDFDNDGIINSVESIWGTDPYKKDTDGDKMPDDWEISYLLNPLDPLDANEDPDKDGKTNYEEYLQGTDPFVKDIQIPFYSYYIIIAILLILFAIPIKRISKSLLTP